MFIFDINCICRRHSIFSILPLDDDAHEEKEENSDSRDCCDVKVMREARKKVVNIPRRDTGQPGSDNDTVWSSSDGINKFKKTKSMMLILGQSISDENSLCNLQMYEIIKHKNDQDKKILKKKRIENGTKKYPKKIIRQTLV